MRISLLVMLLAFLVGCTTVGSQKSIKRLSPEWHDLAEKRLKDNPMPEIRFVFNDHMLGLLYNGGKRFSDSEFRAHVEKHKPLNTEVRYFEGINIHGQKYIRYAVIFLMEKENGISKH